MQGLDLHYGNNGKGSGVITFKFEEDPYKNRRLEICEIRPSWEFP